MTQTFVKQSIEKEVETPNLIKIDGIKVEVCGVLPRHRDAVMMKKLTQQLLQTKTSLVRHAFVKCDVNQIVLAKKSKVPYLCAAKRHRLIIQYQLNGIVRPFELGGEALLI